MDHASKEDWIIHKLFGLLTELTELCEQNHLANNPSTREARAVINSGLSGKPLKYRDSSFTDNARVGN